MEVLLKWGKTLRKKFLATYFIRKSSASKTVALNGICKVHPSTLRMNHSIRISQAVG